VRVDVGRQPSRLHLIVYRLGAQTVPPGPTSSLFAIRAEQTHPVWNRIFRGARSSERQLRLKEEAWGGFDQALAVAISPAPVADLHNNMVCACSAVSVDPTYLPFLTRPFDGD